MQRVKGQTSSVPNNMREIKDERQDTWRTQSNQAYNSTLPASSLPDQYLPSYFAAPVPYPCINQGIGDGRWSNGGDPMAYLGGCGGQIGGDQPSHYVDPMLNQNNFNSFSPGFAFFHSPGADYSAWGNTSLNPRKTATQGDNRDDYYGRELYNPTAYQSTAMKHLERQMEGLSLQTHQNSFPFFKDGYGKPDAMLPPETHTGDHNFIKKLGIFPMPASGITLSEQPMVPKQTSWATVASKPAKQQPKPQSKPIPPLPVHSDKNNTNSMDIGTWENKNGNSEGNGRASAGKIELLNSQPHSSPWTSPRGNRHLNNHQYDLSHSVENNVATPVLDKLYLENNYNPKEFDFNPKNARFFIIKSYSEDDVHRSIKYSIWCSTEHGNKRLDAAFRDSEGKFPIFLLYSVNGSGHFCGMAEMASHVDYNSNSSIWAQDKWKGQFKVKWIYVKDVPNLQLRHIRLENNENKPVTNSRDTQEVPLEKGKQMLKIIHNYNSVTSIFDDFIHYEKRQQEEEKRKISISDHTQ